MTHRAASADADAIARHLMRDAAPRVLGALARRHGDFAAAEDAMQDALIAAAAQWPVAGAPSNPAGWLYRVAARRLNDQLRAELARRDREDAVAVAASPVTVQAELDTDEDETLGLLFMCCHPALSPASAIALTLRAVGGLTTAEIAGAFLVPESTMAQRISRAKQAIRASAIPLEAPSPRERAERLASVLHVVYLVFNEGYTTSAGASLHRTDLSNEAIRLARLLHALLPDDGEVAGLLALLLLTDARRDARTGPHGELVTLDEQDRARWDRAMIDEGIALVSAAMPRGPAGPYLLQAAIAAVHDEAARAEDTDWPQVLALYGVLSRLSDNPMVSLSEAVALGMVHGPAAALARLDALAADPRLRAHHRLDAVRAHFHERAGDVERAIAHYRAAAERTASIPEREYLLMRAARLAAAARS